MTPKPWKMVAKKDVSVGKWLPVEERTYELPNGSLIDDFTVVTLADVAMIVPLTKEGKVVLVKQYKPGAGEVVIQFPAGRKDAKHQNMQEVARRELREETGIEVDVSALCYVGKFNGFTTKGSEYVHIFFAHDLVLSGEQQLDETEEIEVFAVEMQDLEIMIDEGAIVCAQTVAAWDLAKRHFSDIIKFTTMHDRNI